MDYFCCIYVCSLGCPLVLLYMEYFVTKLCLVVDGFGHVNDECLWANVWHVYMNVGCVLCCESLMHYSWPNAHLHPNFGFSNLMKSWAS